MAARGPSSVFVSGNGTTGLTLLDMTKTLAQVIYSDLTAEEFQAVENFCGDNGINYEFSVDDSTWIRLINPVQNVLTALETNVFNGAVSA